MNKQLHIAIRLLKFYDLSKKKKQTPAPKGTPASKAQENLPILFLTAAWYGCKLTTIQQLFH